MTGMIFNIQKFSLHDGPGIRTTVFLKGCPLRCKWCANPESQAQFLEILHDQTKCIQCGCCIQTCQHRALSLNNQRIVFDPKRCSGCLACTKICPSKALSYEGDEKTVEEVVKICLQDLPFYEESGGGVTISGGEGMVQPEFVSRLADRLHEYGIHCAIETTGCVSSSVFRKLASKFDLLLFDVKHHQSSCHKEGTGAGNEQIIENLAWAAQQKLNVLVRIPVIPQFNDSLTDAKGLCTLIKSCGISKVQLLPFHQFGQHKHSLLGRRYEYEGVPALHPEDLEEYLEVFKKADLDCFL